MRLALRYVVILLSLMVADTIWLGSTINPLYKPAMGSLMTGQVNWIGAVGFYLTYTSGVLLLVVKPYLDTPDKNRVALGLKAALLGLVAFGTYDLTGLAVIRDWPLGLSFIDMGWGMITTVIAAQIGAYLPRKA